ncbi:MAG: hypothetical protein ACKVRP_01460 [Bacteroidota bacterium]
MYFEELTQRGSHRRGKSTGFRNYSRSSTGLVFVLSRELEDPTLDFNLDKGISVRNLLYFLSHIEASQKLRDVPESGKSGIETRGV